MQWAPLEYHSMFYFQLEPHFPSKHSLPNDDLIRRQTFVRTSWNEAREKEGVVTCCNRFQVS